MKSFKARLGRDEKLESFKATWVQNTVKQHHVANYEMWKAKYAEPHQTNEDQLLYEYQRFLERAGLIKR